MTLARFAAATLACLGPLVLGGCQQTVCCDGAGCAGGERVDGPDVAANAIWAIHGQRGNDQIDMDAITHGSVFQVELHVGDPVIVNHAVTNLGGATVPHEAYTVKLLIDGQLIAEDPAGAELTPGNFVSYTVMSGSHWTPDAPGTYTCELIVTPSAGLGDTNAANNTLTGEIVVLP